MQQQQKQIFPIRNTKRIYLRRAMRNRYRENARSHTRWRRRRRTCKATPHKQRAGFSQRTYTYKIQQQQWHEEAVVLYLQCLRILSIWLLRFPRRLSNICGLYYANCLLIIWGCWQSESESHARQTANMSIIQIYYIHICKIWCIKTSNKWFQRLFIFKSQVVFFM